MISLLLPSEPKISINLSVFQRLENFVFPSITGTWSKGGHAIIFSYSANRKSENSWAHSAIANPQISYVFQSANRKSTIMKGKKQCVGVIRILISLPLIFFYLQYVSIFQTTKNAMSQTVPKPKVVLEFEWEHFKLLFRMEKDDVFKDLLNFLVRKK